MTGMYSRTLRVSMWHFRHDCCSVDICLWSVRHPSDVCVGACCYMQEVRRQGYHVI